MLLATAPQPSPSLVQRIPRLPYQQTQRECQIHLSTLRRLLKQGISRCNVLLQQPLRVAATYACTLHERRSVGFSLKIGWLCVAISNSSTFSAASRQHDRAYAIFRSAPTTNCLKPHFAARSLSFLTGSPISLFRENVSALQQFCKAVNLPSRCRSSDISGKSVTSHLLHWSKVSRGIQPAPRFFTVVNPLTFSTMAKLNDKNETDHVKPTGM